MIITADDVLSWHPCPDYTAARVRELMGTGLTPAQVSELPIPVEDRFWVFAHALSPVEARLLACDIAETVAHLGGQVCVDTIAVARRYAHGEATDEELAAARFAAWSAAGFAAESTACLAAESTAWQRYLAMAVERLDALDAGPERATGLNTDTKEYNDDSGYRSCY